MDVEQMLPRAMTRQSVQLGASWPITPWFLKIIPRQTLGLRVPRSEKLPYTYVRVPRLAPRAIVCVSQPQRLEETIVII